MAKKDSVYSMSSINADQTVASLGNRNEDLNVTFMMLK